MHKTRKALDQQQEAELANRDLEEEGCIYYDDVEEVEENKLLED